MEKTDKRRRQVPVSVSVGGRGGGRTNAERDGGVSNGASSRLSGTRMRTRTACWGTGASGPPEGRASGPANRKSAAVNGGGASAGCGGSAAILLENARLLPLKRRRFTYTHARTVIRRLERRLVSADTYTRARDRTHYTRLHLPPCAHCLARPRVPRGRDTRCHGDNRSFLIADFPRDDPRRRRRRHGVPEAVVPHPGLDGRRPADSK